MERKGMIERNSWEEGRERDERTQGWREGEKGNDKVRDGEIMTEERE